MITRTRSAKLAALVALVALPLGMAACSTTPDAGTSPSVAASSAPASSAPASSPAAPSSSAAASTDADSAPFGPGCSSVPDTGKGSFDGMSKDPVATAASNNEQLSTLVTAVKAAGLVDTLNNADDITVFAPINGAFSDMDQATLKKALADPKGLLTNVLTAHVVPGRLAPSDLAGEHETLNKDQPLTVTGSGEDFTVNGSAKVVCGNVQTANATVYLIDGVLLPSS